MISSTARVRTEHPNRYLGQLCKHFAHKIPVHMAPDVKPVEGRITFAFGVCHLAAEPGLLTMRAEAEDDAGFLKLQDVIVRHLDRFAHRDQPGIVWERS